MEGSVGASTNAEALKELTDGRFKKPIITQKTISADNSTVVQVYYERVDVKLTLKATDGKFADGKDSKTLEGKFGETITLPAEPTRAGFQFAGWDGIPATFPKKNEAYSAKWSNKPQADYTVNHWKQKIDGTTGKVIGDETNGANYEVSSDTQTLKGEVGANTGAKAKTQADAGYEGFTALEVTQQKIVAGGATVIDIYYKRNAVKLTFKGDGGKFTGDKESVEYNGKYGEKLSAYAFTTPKKEDFKFKGWKSGAATSVMNVEYFPAENAVYTAEWEALPDPNYMVKHWKQKLGTNDKVIGNEHNETNFELAHEETLTGKKGEMTNAQAKDVTSGSYKGFVLPEITQKKIDDNTVIDLYYLRKDVTLTFKGNGAKLKDKDGAEKETVTLSGKFGETIATADVPKLAAADNLNANGDKFAGWNKSPGDKFPDENATFTATWTEFKELKITKPAKVTTYFVGEKTLNKEDLQVKAVYKDGSSEPVTDQCTDNLKEISGTAGNQKVTLTYRGHTVEYDVEIKVKPAATFEVGDIIDSDGQKYKANVFTKETGKTYYVIVKVVGTTYHAVRLWKSEYDPIQLGRGRFDNVYNRLMSGEKPLNKAQMQATRNAKDTFFAAFDKFGLTIKEEDKTIIRDLTDKYCFYKDGYDWKVMVGDKEYDEFSSSPPYNSGINFSSPTFIPLVVREFKK